MTSSDCRDNSCWWHLVGLPGEKSPCCFMRLFQFLRWFETVNISTMDRWITVWELPDSYSFGPKACWIILTVSFCGGPWLYIVAFCETTSCPRGSVGAALTTAGLDVLCGHTKIDLPRDWEGYGGFEYTDEKHSTRRIHWCRVNFYIFF